MTERIYRRQNKNDVAVISPGRVLNTGVSVVISPVNPRRIFFKVSMEASTSDECMFIKLQAAALDDLLKGIPLYRLTLGNSNVWILEWTMPVDNIYTGEISAIEGIGTPKIFVTEY